MAFRLSNVLLLIGELWIIFMLCGASAESPSTRSDLICHTSNPTECYPRVFVPTKDFQIIRDDQDLPPGLHVRMNIYTGLKEARLNIPMADELETLKIPTEQAMVVIPNPAEDSVSHEATPDNLDIPALRDRVPQKPPVYEAAGKIQPPVDKDGSGESAEIFWKALEFIGQRLFQDTQDQYDSLINDYDGISKALVTLVDFSHDIYYGLEIMKRGEVLRMLTFIMVDDGSKPPYGHELRASAASVIRNSIQNNPTALTAAKDSWTQLMKPQCQSNCETRSLASRIYQSLSVEDAPDAMRAKISTLRGLFRDPMMRDELVEAKVIDFLHATFRPTKQGWTGVQHSIAHALLDTFLDEDMGAHLGIWPSQPALPSEVCARQETSVEDGCWEMSIRQKISEDDPSSIYVEFLAILEKRRAEVSEGSRKGVAHQEL